MTAAKGEITILGYIPRKIKEYVYKTRPKDVVRYFESQLAKIDGVNPSVQWHLEYNIHPSDRRYVGYRIITIETRAPLRTDGFDPYHEVVKQGVLLMDRYPEHCIDVRCLPFVDDEPSSDVK